MKHSFIIGMRSDDISMRFRRNRVDDTYYTKEKHNYEKVF